MKKRLVAFLLVLIMVLGMLPVSAFAADDGVSPQALESNETQTIKYQILYVGDEFNTGYNYGVSVNKTYTCQYSTGHSGFNHSILISEFRNVGVPALKGQLDSGYEFVGWAKEAKKNPTIFDFNTAGTTATQTTYTIYLVAKKAVPPTVTYTLTYYPNTTDLVTNMPSPNPVTQKSSTSPVTFTVSSARPSRDGYTFKGWADSAADTTAQYQPGGMIAVNHADSPKTIYAVWECSHVKDNDGNCTVPGCTHPDSCCPKPEDPKPDVIPEPNPDDDNPNPPFHVWVKCITPNSGHSSGFLPISYVEGGYTRTWAEGQDTCTFVLDTQKYADFYSGLTNAGGKAHTATVSSLTQVYKYNKVCNDKNFPDAPRTHKLLTQETVQWRLYATSEADEKIGNNVPNHVWEAEPVKAGKDDVCTIAHNLVVTFDPNGGTPVPLAQEVEYGHTATKPVEPTLKGYTFDGWYLDGEEEPFDFGTTITSDITLTAKWEINKYTVTFDSYGGSKVDPQVVEYGLYAQEPEEPTLKGFTFAY